jgi:hypothetical protein
MTKSETPKAFFSRILKGLRSPEETFLHDRILVIGHVVWGTDHLRRLSLQSLCLVNGSFEDWMHGLDDLSDDDFHYFRLDIHPDALGQLFSEPIPHVHSLPHGAPRFSFQSTLTQTLIPDFIGFLFRNYAYEDWERWVGVVWKEGHLYSKDEDPYERILEAFRDSQFLLLSETYKKEMTELKECLSSALLDASTQFLPLPEEYKLLSY